MVTHTTQADSTDNHPGPIVERGTLVAVFQVRLKACNGITLRKLQSCGFTVGIAPSSLQLEDRARVVHTRFFRSPNRIDYVLGVQYLFLEHLCTFSHEHDPKTKM